MEIAVLGLGCFWGPEIKFSKLEGVIKTEVGYCGGDSKEVTYKEVCTGNTVRRVKHISVALWDPHNLSCLRGIC